ncbi:MAG: quinone-dependent dihydroorotate dehydrogenase [Chloroflexota bacterium]|nr:quinone-dependent dihydroorotate dehydrogenase [Chloroflexota bacterium]
MYSLVRSLLFRLEPETAHRLTLGLLRIGGTEPLRSIVKVAFSTPDRPIRAFGLTFKNAVGLAAGYDKDAVAISGLSALGFSHLEIGTVTPRPQPGNPRPRVFRLVEDEAVINRMGFPSRGSEYVQRQFNPSIQNSVTAKLRRLMSQKKLPTMVRNTGVIFGINLGKNKDTPNEQAVLDYLELLQCFAPYADYLAINVSSPNTVGLRQLQGRSALEGLLSQLNTQRRLTEAQLEKRLPLLVKLAPDLTDPELDEAVGVILDTGMDGIIVTNTTLARKGLRSRHQDEAGGLSGSPLRPRSEAVLRQVIQRVNGTIPIVSVGGIMSPLDAKRRLESGATLVQLYTGLIYQGPGLVKKIVAEK